jgi:hypothetical protein
MKRRPILSLALCPLVGAIASCDKEEESFVSVRSDRVKLMDPFESYASITDVEDILRRLGYTWHAKEGDSTVVKGESRPQFQVYVVQVDDFAHLEIKGMLRLEFFNNRLMATWFYPANLSVSREMIEKRYPEVRAKGGGIIRKNTSIEFGVDHDKRGYIVWEDIRLRDELNLWIERYA